MLIVHILLILAGINFVVGFILCIWACCRVSTWHRNEDNVADAYWEPAEQNR